jgi:FAD/FMN-containing dehydrogenase
MKVLYKDNEAKEAIVLVEAKPGAIIPEHVHGGAGHSVCEGGLMIDLSRMNSVLVDRSRRVARVAGGAKWLDFDHETQAFGLATTGGTNSDTGIGGLTLGGGIGWLAGKYGLTCDNLLSADVVTADGMLVTASATENSDLFWSLRGGSGNFGIVASFEYQLREVTMVLAGLVINHSNAPGRLCSAKITAVT